VPSPAGRLTLQFGCLCQALLVAVRRACMAPKSKRGKGKGEKKKKDEKGDCFNLASTNYSLFETACMVDTIVRAFNLCFLVVF
jgi:hypothetical protein